MLSLHGGELGEVFGTAPTANRVEFENYAAKVAA